MEHGSGAFFRGKWTSILTQKAYASVDSRRTIPFQFSYGCDAVIMKSPAEPCYSSAGNHCLAQYRLTFFVSSPGYRDHCSSRERKCLWRRSIESLRVIAPGDIHYLTVLDNQLRIALIKAVVFRFHDGLGNGIDARDDQRLLENRLFIVPGSSWVPLTPRQIGI